MQSTSTDPTGDNVEELTIQVRDLVITVRPRAGGPRSEVDSRGESAEVPLASPVRGTEAAASAADDWSVVEPTTSRVIPGRSVVWEARLLAAESLEALRAVDCTPLRVYALQLRATVGEWTPTLRIARAYRAGLLARDLLRGESVSGPALQLGIQNRIYVVLRGAPGQSAGWTEDLSRYRQAVGGSANSFQRDSISHAFPSRVEAEVYALAAQVAWPPAYPARH